MFVGGKSETGAGAFDEFRTAFAVALGGAGDFRDAFADEGLGDDHLRAAVLVRLGLFDRGGDGGEVVAVDGDRVPALGGEILLRVLALGDVGHGVERHVVGIIDEDQVIEAVVAGEGDGLLGDAFLKAAVAVDGEDVLVEDRVLRGVEARGGAFAGERVADGIADALAERAGGRLDARRFMELRVPRRDRVQRAEFFHLVTGNRVTGEMQPAVEEHRAVAGGENEAVAVEPLRGIRVVAHGLAEQHGTDFGAAERQAEVAGVTGVDGIHGEATGFIGGLSERIRIHEKSVVRPDFKGRSAETLEILPRLTS